LIIGDRRTGKTTLGLQAMVAQSRLGVVVIYASIGQRASATADAISYLRAHGDFAQAIAMVAGPDDAAGLQWLLPFAATTMAEFFVAKGRDVLIVYDDLIKHAAVHRQVSLLLRQAPGREAFPGDIFHLHARLLERAGQLSAAKGGGSLSALAIAELQAGNLTAYIPTNLVSITDGQVLMDAKLWQAGHRPAIDIGLSVSRIGGRAQSEAIRTAAGQIRLDYAQYLDLESFVRFGGAVEPKTAVRLEHGRRIRACLIQQANEDVSQSGLLALLRAMGTGALDHLAPVQMVDVRQRLTAEIDERAPALKPLLSAGQPLTETAIQALDAAIAAVAV
jgi:F-type H+-transporting ATPase subunit alpha